MTQIVDRIKVIDTDSHLVEPPDLWTSRLPSRLGDDVPHVRWDDEAQDEAWFVRDVRLLAVGGAAQAGWPEYPPAHPPTWADVDHATWDPVARLARMDRAGIYAQVLYPNLGIFANGEIWRMVGQDLLTQFTLAYNDHQTEFCSASPDRLIPITSVPFWDLDASLAEIDRCALAGHRGINFSQDPSSYGLPILADRHWDPVWASAQEKGLTVNFHIGSSDGTLQLPLATLAMGVNAGFAAASFSLFLGNAKTLTQLICGGVCHRFPDLNFVSVESGIGWIPFALEGLDWQWRNSGVAIEHPEYQLTPSEYFRRQIYGMFWFEAGSAQAAIELLGPDNVLFETDYPHPVSMSPGPASSAVEPRDYIERTFSQLSESTTNKILFQNASRLYGIQARDGCIDPGQS
jgi:predicted TIM-barrel fold metal-dependent hydrolase